MKKKTLALLCVLYGAVVSVAIFLAGCGTIHLGKLGGDW